jgi:hypothetical protein
MYWQMPYLSILTDTFVNILPTRYPYHVRFGPLFLQKCLKTRDFSCAMSFRRLLGFSGTPPPPSAFFSAPFRWPPQKNTTPLIRSLWKWFEKGWRTCPRRNLRTEARESSRHWLSTKLTSIRLRTILASKQGSTSHEGWLTELLADSIGSMTRCIRFLLQGCFSHRSIPSNMPMTSRRFAMR